MRWTSALLCVGTLLLTGCVPPAQLRLSARPELPYTIPVRAAAGYDGVSAQVRLAAIGALSDAGLVVLTTEPRRAEEYLLVLPATCDRDVWRLWRCSEFSMRMVDRQSSEIKAAASLDRLTGASARLAAIREALTDSIRGPLRKGTAP